MFWNFLVILSKSSTYSSSYSSTDSEGALGAILALGVLWMVVIGIVILSVIVLQIVMLWRIIGKTGYSGGLSLLILIPGLGSLAIFIVFLIMAFSKWPIERELESYKTRAYSPSQTYVNLQTPPPGQTPPPPPPPIN